MLRLGWSRRSPPSMRSGSWRARRGRRLHGPCRTAGIFIHRIGLRYDGEFTMRPRGHWDEQGDYGQVSGLPRAEPIGAFYRGAAR